MKDDGATGIQAVLPSDRLAAWLFLNTHISLLNSEYIFTVNYYSKGILANG
ncbi:MAG: hypothetical protein AB7S77_22400 [Desulfatirhabdiaceae bacterium]